MPVAIPMRLTSTCTNRSGDIPRIMALCSYPCARRCTTDSELPGRNALTRPATGPPLPPKQTHAPRQTSRRTLPAVDFVYWSVECPFDKFYGIDCSAKSGAKLLDRFFHRRRQVSPPVNNLTHCFFDRFQHFLYRNFTVGSRHGAVACLSAD